MSKPTIKQLVEVCKKVSYNESDDSLLSHDVEKALEFLFNFGFIDSSKIKSESSPPILIDEQFVEILKKGK